MFVLLDIVQKLRTQFLKFALLPLFMALEVIKKKSKKMNKKRSLKPLLFNRFLIVLPF
jgi:hypothetical protein